MNDSLAQARATLKRTFGFDDFRAGQTPAIEALLGGEDVLAVMPTGAGKSVCYQIPALLMEGLTIVVSPLVALMEDQVAALKLNGVAAATINSSRDRETNISVWRQVAAGEIRLLYLSPERLMTQRMVTALQRLEPAMFAIDEAHCISRWGAAFRPEYEQLGHLRDAFPEARLSAFTATADPATRDDIVAKLYRRSPQIFVAGFDRPNISLGVQARTKWQDQLAEFLTERSHQSGIVYALSRKNVDQIAAFLSECGINALPYHAGMDAAQRSANQDRFMTEKASVMVATIAFGMGIDKPDIRFVVHTHLPSNIEAYYQEIGRAGRDGAASDALMLFGLDDLRMRRKFIDEDASDADNKRREHKRLDALVAYAEASTCRRVMLLSYFGDAISPCGNCDICLDPPNMIDATAQAKLALSAVKQTGQRFGAAHIIDVLRGSENQRVKDLNHDALPCHAKGEAHSKPWWQAFIRQLLSSGHLALDIQGFGGLQLTPTGMDILQGITEFSCRDVLVKPKRKAERKTERKTERRGSAPVEVQAEDQDLVTALKALRLQLARTRKVPPYVIFHDRTLFAMAAEKPKSLDDFLDLPGVGKSKAEAFGADFLDLLSAADGKGHTV